MPAIAPPMQNQPVQPIEPDTPVGGAVAPVQADAASDLHSLYEDAVNSGNPASMYSLTARVKGTPYEAPVRRSAEIMEKNVSELEADVKPVLEAGGPGTPKGNLAAAQVYESIADKPQKTRAFVELLLGNPKWRTFVTGGTPTTTVGFDRNGKQLEKTVDELGRTISVVDAETGKPLNRQEVADRGGFLSSLDNALGFQQQKELSRINALAFGKATEAVNEAAAKAPELRNLYQEMRSNLEKLHQADLTPEQRKAIGVFTSRTMGYSQSVSDGMNALTQKLDNKNVRLSEGQQKSLGSVLNVLGWKVSGDGSLTKENGEAVTKSDLNQAQNTLSNSKEFARNYTQSKEDFLRNEVFKDLSPRAREMLGRTLDLQGNIERSLLETTSKNGTLPFLINPKSYQIGDEFTRGEASALIGEFNQDAAEMFAAWRDKQLASYKSKGLLPSAGELERAFAQTTEYKSLRRSYADRNKEILSRPMAISNAASAPPAEAWQDDLGLVVPKIKERSIKGEGAKPPAASPATKAPSARELARQLGGRE